MNHDDFIAEELKRIKEREDEEKRIDMLIEESRNEEEKEYLKNFSYFLKYAELLQSNKSDVLRIFKANTVNSNNKTEISFRNTYFDAEAVNIETIKDIKNNKLILGIELKNSKIKKMHKVSYLLKSKIFYKYITLSDRNIENIKKICIPKIKFFSFNILKENINNSISTYDIEKLYYALEIEYDKYKNVYYLKTLEDEYLEDYKIAFVSKQPRANIMNNYVNELIHEKELKMIINDLYLDLDKIMLKNSTDTKILNVNVKDKYKKKEFFVDEENIFAFFDERIILNYPAFYVNEVKNNSIKI